MKILCTHPGRHGDILWALPTVRAISRYFAQPVDFATSWPYRKVCEVINGQDYIGHAWGAEGWKILETGPMTPQAIPEEVLGQLSLKYDHVFNLGLTEWPMAPIAEYTRIRASDRYPELPIGNAELDLDDPWIRVKAGYPGVAVVALGWNELWIELKMGISFALFQRFGRYPERPNHWPVNFHLVYYQDARHAEWKELLPAHVGRHATNSWLIRAGVLAESKVYVGCLGAMWVLANAMGMRTVIAEPAEPRWNKAFWRESTRNTLVLGHDGKPTFDARAIGDALETALREQGVNPWQDGTR